MNDQIRLHLKCGIASLVTILVRLTFLNQPLLHLSIYSLRDAAKELRILDPTMGWGGRVVAACAFGAKSYTGIDINTQLEQPYTKLTHFLSSLDDMNTSIECHFTYSRLSYNMVLTSPPYYDIETYPNMNTFQTKGME